MKSKKHLIEPHGGELIDLMNRGKIIKDIGQAKDLFSIDLDAKQLSDLELLMNGAYSPLTGFMKKDLYALVCNELKLVHGLFWPLPITLDVSEEQVARIDSGDKIALKDSEGVILAVMRVEDIWQPDLKSEAEFLFNTHDKSNERANSFQKNTKKYYIGGEIQGIESPVHYDFPTLRLTPLEVRREFGRLGWLRVMAYQASNFIHRAHHEFMLRASLNEKTNLLIQGISNTQLLPDRGYFTRIRCYKAILPYFPQLKVLLTLLPYFQRNAGFREALLQAIISKNYGCTHYILNPEEIGSSPDKHDDINGIRKYENEIGIKIIPLQELVYVRDLDQFEDRTTIPKNMEVEKISDANIMKRLKSGQALPKWLIFPKVQNELKKSYPSRNKQGFTVFFTGLSGSGKSTMAKVLRTRLLQLGNRPVTLLDGDIVRKNLSSELGFSRIHRDLNIKRIGFVASEITKNYGVAICAPIAPYDGVRKEIRELIESHGGFILVHVATPLEECEKRDRKGLYAKARAGVLKEFTGISDPYEVPDDADIIIDTTSLTPDEGVMEIMIHLEKQGYIGVESDEDE